MASVPATGSFEDRREVMRKVQHMVAEAEALNKTRNLRREEVHVSDASASSESEGEFPDIPNVSPILNIGCDSSTQKSSKPRSRNRRKITPRLAFTDEIELEALSAPQSFSRPGIQRPPPQDKPLDGLVSSTAKLDRSVASTSKSSTSTPSRLNDTLTSNLYRGGPVNSICSTVKIDRSLPVIPKNYGVNSNATPMNIYRGVPVNSPPFSIDSPAVTTPESSLALSTSSSRNNLLNMKKEIDDLTAQFETFEKRSKERNINSSCKKTNFKNAEKAFEEGVDIMGKKTDAVIDALHRNLSNSQIVSRENDRLRGRVHNLSKSQKYLSPATPENGGEICDKNQSNHLGPGKTVDHFDPSNEYLRRRYPAVPTTPGTMFVSEIVEVLNLDVGDHTYLSDIMNKQWAASPDYVPS